MNKAAIDRAHAINDEIGKWASKTGETGAHILAGIYRWMMRGASLKDAVARVYVNEERKYRRELGDDLFEQMKQEGKLSWTDRMAKIAADLSERDVRQYLNAELGRTMGADVRDVKITYVTDDGDYAGLEADVQFGGRGLRTKGGIGIDRSRNKFFSWHLAFPAMQIGDSGLRAAGLKTAMSLNGGDVKNFLNGELGRSIGGKIESLKLFDIPGRTRGQDARIEADIVLGHSNILEVEGTISVKEGNVTSWNIVIPPLQVQHNEIFQWDKSGLGLHHRLSSQGLNDKIYVALEEMGLNLRSKTAGDIRWQAVFFIGPAGSGKSFVRDNKYLTHSGFKAIDPDEIKKRHPNYDPENPFEVHEWSQEMAMAQFKQVIKAGNGDSVIVDGTGRNLGKMQDLIGMASGAGYRTFLVYVWVPFEISIFRNRNRTRFVPEEMIMKQSESITHNFGVLRGMVDSYKVIENFSSSEMKLAQRDVALYPPPQAVRPPRQGEELQRAASANRTAMLQSVLAELKRAEPFKTVMSYGDERQFIYKAKRVLSKFGVKGWMVDAAVENIKRRRAGPVIMYVDAKTLFDELVRAGDLKETTMNTTASEQPKVAKKITAGYPTIYFTHPEDKERADRYGLMDVESEYLTAPGLIAKMIEWNETEHGVEAFVYDDAVKLLRRMGKSMPAGITRLASERKADMKEQIIADRVAKNVMADDDPNEVYQKLLEYVEKKGIAILTAQDIHKNVPTIHNFAKKYHDSVNHLGYGCFRGKTEHGEFTFDAGGAMNRDGNVSWTTLSADEQVLRDLGYDMNKVARALKELIEKSAKTAGSKQAGLMLSGAVKALYYAQHRIATLARDLEKKMMVLSGKLQSPVYAEDKNEVLQSVSFTKDILGDLVKAATELEGNLNGIGEAVWNVKEASEEPVSRFSSMVDKVAYKTYQLVKDVTTGGGNFFTAGTTLRVVSYSKDAPHYLVKLQDNTGRGFAVTPAGGYRYLRGFPKPPSVGQMERWMNDGRAKAIDGATVEPDGYSADGAPSWMLIMGMI